MPRPDVSSDSGVKFGGYTYDSLRISGLARNILIKLGYCHTCSPNYCLAGRSCCRFFFPWPQQPYQVQPHHQDEFGVVRVFRPNMYYLDGAVAMRIPNALR